MAAPSATTRQTPTGYKMPEGYSAKITFASAPALQLWERDVKPPGLDGGEPIDTTTQHNNEWITMAFRSLKKLDMQNVVCAYDIDAWETIRGLVNRDDTITIRYPNGATLAFYGGCYKADFAELKIGEFPLVTLSIAATNEDSDGVEQSPVFTPAAGT